ETSGPVYRNRAKGRASVGSNVCLLAVRGGLDRFMDALASLAYRRFRGGLDVTDGGRRSLKGRLRESLRRVLGDHLYYNEACLSSGALLARPERRIWDGP